jgi:hypothetical protein
MDLGSHLALAVEAFAIPDDIDLGNIMLGQSPAAAPLLRACRLMTSGPWGNTFQPLHEVRQTDAGVISETSGSHGQTMAKPLPTK